MKIHDCGKNISPRESDQTSPHEQVKGKEANLRSLYSSLREKHEFLQTLEKQGVPVADLQTLRTRTEHALNELQGIMAELGTAV